MKDNEIFAYYDFAMKWLPKYFRESQEAHYGKAGASIHVTGRVNCLA